MISAALSKIVDGHFKIPLNPPLEKGEVEIPLNPPLEKGEDEVLSFDQDKSKG